MRMDCVTVDMSQFILDIVEKRVIHSCGLYDLKPNTTYYFQTCMDVPDNTLGTKQLCGVERKFKTLHNVDEDVVFVAGGDYGSDKDGDDVCVFKRCFFTHF